MPAQITRQAPDVTARSFGVNLYRAAADQSLTVSQLLERMDPTSEREEGDRQLDAFERVLAESGLVTNAVPEVGVQASTWQEATETAERRALMPELISRVWRHTTHKPSAPTTPGTRAMLLSGDYPINNVLNPWAQAADGLRAPTLAPAIPLDLLVARTTGIDTDGYRSLYLSDSLNTDAYRMKRIAEGTEIPATTLITGEHTIRLTKYGRALRATYEQLRRQRLDRIAFIVQRMALQAEADKVTQVLNVIVSGDGNANTAAATYAQTSLDAGSAAGTLTLKAWMVFKLRFTQAYRPTVVLGQEASILQLLLLPVLTSTNQLPLAMATGPFGALRPVGGVPNELAQGEAYGVTADAPALKLVAFDPNQAVERVTEIGGEVSEVERFINNQTTMMTMTEVEGYGVIDANASRLLNING